jgi:pimeloyl-ACP methyl ester carboxylesterase
VTPASAAPVLDDSSSPVSSRYRSKSRRYAQVAAVLAASALALSACGKPSPKTQTGVSVSADPTDTPTGSDAGGIDADLLPFYEQTVTWSVCGSGFECADIEVPLDWDDPAKDTITIAAKRYVTEGERAGTLLINPGGPGASGIEFVGYVPYFFGQSILDTYDVLGFDPRGVGESSPVTCETDAERDASDAKAHAMDDVGLAEISADAKAFGEACLENTGDVLGEVDTQSAARDMDVIRQVVGDEKLNYLGFSYGTRLGATYAGIYPENVGKMVLDGAIDLRLTDHEQSMQQAVGFENALRSYVEDCLGGTDCPLSGTVDEAMAQVKALLDQTLVNPLPTEDSNRPLTQSLAFYGIAQPLYSLSLWPQLTGALDGAIIDGDGTALLANADSYNGRNGDGTYADNSGEAFRAINCLDTRGETDRAVMDTEAAEIMAAAPTMGEFFTYGGLGCAEWPFPQVEQDFDLAAAGAPAILVIGTTNDPATPYVWAQGLAEQLDSGVLLTYEGEGHTAYGTSNSCVADTVDEFIVDGTVPEDGRVC